MARRIVSIVTITPTGTADGANNLVDNTYPMVVQGGSSTQVVNIWEISISGQASAASSPTYMILSYDQQAGTGGNGRGSGQTDTAMNPATVALAAPTVTGNTFATLKPQRSTTLHLANASLNAFGGMYFWRANKTEECFQVLGNGNTTGEISLSASNAGGSPGAIGAHLIYESL